MPWVRRHRRHEPYSWFRTTSVRSHYRRAPGSIPIVPIALVAGLILLLVLIF